MGRVWRVDVGEMVYHALNRANFRSRLFGARRIMKIFSVSCRRLSISCPCASWLTARCPTIGTWRCIPERIGSSRPSHLTIFLTKPRQVVY